MPNSFAQSETLACPRCSQSLPVETWLIVDVDERPDLAARARAGILHDVICPACGPLGRVDAPLLLFFPNRDSSIGQPPLLFSPSQRSSAEADQQVAGSLLQMLAQGLGDAWQEAWLGEIATVQRALLPVALSADPAAALQALSKQRREDAEEEEEMPPAVASVLEEMLEQLAAEGVEVRSPEDLEAALASRPELRAKLEAVMRGISPDDNPGIFRDSGIVPDGDHAPPLHALLDRFVRLNTWDDAQRTVEEYPALLSDEADQMLAGAIAQAEAQQDANAVEHFTRLQAVLRRCRAAGVACAFAEQRLPLEMLAEAERLRLAPEEFLA